MEPERDLLHRTRLPDALWRRAVECMVGDPACTAVRLGSAIEVGSYRTAWRTAGIIRQAMGRVKWPKLNGEVEMGELELLSGKRIAHPLWIARVASGRRAGMIRAWLEKQPFIASARQVTRHLGPGAVLITPPGPYVLAIKGRVRLRSRPLGEKEAFDGICAVMDAFHSQLLARSHRGLDPATVEGYVHEFVFHRNATVLRWKDARRVEEVWAQLRPAERRLSA